MENLVFTARIVAPVFVIIFVGLLLKQLRIVTEDFNRLTSKVVFNVAMPALLFQELSSIPIKEIFNPWQILFVVAVVFFMFGLCWVISIFLCKNGADQGAFIQGSFRGNFAILGLALVENAYGAGALASAAIVLAVIMPLYNVLAVIALTVPLHRDSRLSPWKTLLTILTNPLIIAAALALPFSFLQIPLHPILTDTIDYLAGLTLPLALIGIGSSLSFASVRQDRNLSLAATFIKVVLMPLLCTPAAIYLGFRGQDLGVLYFMFSSPAAIASYIMAHALGSNGRLAGNIVLLSTLVSLFTISAGIYILRASGYF